MANATHNKRFEMDSLRRRFAPAPLATQTEIGDVSAGRALRNSRISGTYPAGRERFCFRLENLYHAQQFVFYLHFN